MPSNIIPSDVIDVVMSQPIRVVVDRYPEAMPVLARYGIDLCCGGGHTIEEAATLHGLEPAELIAQVTEAIRREQA